jgi:flagellar hook-basal body complex protein FliE
MAIDPLLSLSGFTPLGTMQPKKALGSGSQPGGASDFTSVLSSLATQTASTIRASEDAAIKGIQGQAPLQEVVQSVMQAQTSLQMAMALRDKAVLAYQDLTRMTI